MRILQILPEMNVGGVETGTVDFAKYLLQNGHEAFVVSHGGALVEELTRHGVKHIKLSVHEKNFWLMMKMVKVLRKVIEDNKIDIVHARSRVPAWIAYFACRRTKAEFITTCHGYYRNRWFSQVMGWAKYIIVPSQIIGRHMIDRYKVPQENIRCIPRSVDTQRFENIQRKKNSSERIIAVVGRITPIKGHTYFLQAMAKVLRHVPNLKIWIIGDAPPNKQAYYKEILALVTRLGIAQQVEFLGRRGDIPQLLAGVDVLVMPSVYPESFGRVILEAQAARVPVVATQIGGIVDIIDDRKTGLLVLPKDPEAMAQAVLQILDSPQLAASLVENALVKIEKEFTLDKMASRTIAVYEELLKRKNILVIKLSSIGDVVLVTASLKAIREKFPTAKLFCLVGQESRKILQNCPYIDELIIVDFKDRDKGLKHFWNLTKNLRALNLDCVIDFQNSRKSHWLSFLSFPKTSYGFNNGKWGNLLTNGIKETSPATISPVAHQFQVLKLLNISYRDNLALELWPSAHDERVVKDLLESEWLTTSKKIVGINVAASLKWQTKNWPVEYIAQLCDKLAAKNIRVALTGTTKDQPLVHELLKKTRSKPANFVGKTDVVELAALIKHFNVFITPDSAPLHIAAAMQVPTIVFFGPTDSRRHLPPGKNIVVFEKKLACAPCYSSHCKILTQVCMRDISPSDVLETIEKLLETAVR